MASLFHTHDVVMAGVDIHAIDDPAVPVSPCAVGKPFDLIPDNGKYAASVTGHGFALVQVGFKGEVVPHATLPVTGPGVVKLALAVMNGTTQCELGVASVSAEGTALACSIDEFFGVNLNCNSAPGGISGKLPTGITFSYYPIMTQPTVQDWAAAGRTMLVDSLWSTIVDQFLRAVVPGEGIEKTVLEKFVKKFIMSDHQKQFQEVTKRVDRWLDSQVEGYVDTALV